MTPQDRLDLIAEIILAIKSAEPKLCPEELRWVKNAIKAQEEKRAFRQAVIQKTITGVVWMMVLAVGTVFYEYARNHGFKP